MAILYRLTPGIVSSITTGGLSVQVADTLMGEKGGVIVNPKHSKDQGLGGLPAAESLFVSLLGPAKLGAVAGTTELFPGQWFLVPPNTNVWVNAASAGHQFSAWFSAIYTPSYPPNIVPGQPGSGVAAIAGEAGSAPFPPPGVTGLTRVLPSYLYQEYTDDDDLQGFVAAQNNMQQNYVDTFNALNLPIYTGGLVAGALLDWVGRGLYGMARPALSSGQPSVQGPLNTYGCNWLIPMWATVGPDVGSMFGLNELLSVGPESVVITNDDLYRRILTWHFYKGDGKYFSMRWMKRRVWRFLYGKDGLSPDWTDDPYSDVPPIGTVAADRNDASIADTEQISITIGTYRNITIRFVLYDRPVTGGAMMNAFGCNGFQVARDVIPPWNIGEDTTAGPTGIPAPKGIYINELETTFTPLKPLPYMQEFKEALDSGVLEVPYQWNWTCHIG